MGTPEHADPAASRRRRSIVTFTVVGLLLFFAFWYAMSYIRADAGRAAPTPETTSAPSCAIAPEDVTVAVLNGTTRDGLAGTVAKQLRSRGFAVSKVANNPAGQDVPGRGVLRSGPDQEDERELVVKHVGELTDQNAEGGSDPVTVILGKDFDGLPGAVDDGC